MFTRTSILALAAFATFAHFTVSLRKYAPNSSGVLATTSPPSPARRDTTSGLLRTATASLCSFAMMSFDTAAGASRPYHWSDS